MKASSKLELVIRRIRVNSASLNPTIKDNSRDELRRITDEAKEQKASILNPLDIRIPFDYLEATYSDEH